MRTFFILLVLALVVFPAAASQPGVLDPTFGSGGMVTLNNADARDVVVLPDGKILTGGNGMLAQFEADGQPDADFGTGGVVSDGNIEQLTAITVDGAGRIYAVGQSGLQGIIARYTADGTLDTTFDTDGLLTVNAVLSVDDITIDANGRVVVVGSSAGDGLVLRYLDNGAPDTGFDSDGTVVTGADSATAVVIDGNGKIVVGGSVVYSSYLSGKLARYNDDGTPDGSFNSAELQSIGEINALTLDDSGRIVAAGNSLHTGSLLAMSSVIARFNNDGSLDDTLDASFLPHVKTRAEDVVIDSSGRLIVVITTGLYSQFVVARYQADGTPDASFGEDNAEGAAAITELSAEHDWYFGVALDGDGKIVTAGTYETNGDKTALIVARYYNEQADDANLMRNASFERAVNRGWSQVNATTDERKCFAGAEYPAIDGVCMFKFRGGTGENSRLVQKVNLQNQVLNTGDSLSLTGFVLAQGKTNLHMNVVVRYANGESQQIQIALKQPTRGVYRPVGKTITLDGTPKSITVTILNKGTSGLVLVEDLGLVVTRAAAEGWLPLPQ